MSLGAAAIALGACSGKAVIDAPGSGGGGGTTTTTTGTSTTTTSSSTTTSSTTSTTSTGDLCALLEDDLVAKIAAAQACNPLINALQCTGNTTLLDTCGCDIVAADQHAAEAAVALDAYDAWVAEGCGPYLCSTCPPPPNSPWYCDPDLSQCVPAYE